jgi:excisionase family DNA binding protein
VPDELLTVEEVAERLKLSQETIRIWLRNGRLSGIRLGTRRSGWRVRASEIDRLIEAGKAKAA